MRPDERIELVIKKIMAKLALLEIDHPEGHGASQPGLRKEFEAFVNAIKSELSAPTSSNASVFPTFNYYGALVTRRISMGAIEKAFSHSTYPAFQSGKFSFKLMEEYLNRLKDELGILQKRILVGQAGYLEDFPAPQNTLAVAIPIPTSPIDKSIMAARSLRLSKKHFKNRLRLRNPLLKKNSKPAKIETGGKLGKRLEYEFGEFRFYLTPNQKSVISHLRKEKKVFKVQSKLLKKIGLEHTTMAQIFRADRKSPENMHMGENINDRQIASLLIDGFPPKAFKISKKAI